MNRDKRQVFTEWLVLQAQAGDEKAFTELYALWAPDLRRLALLQLEKAQHAEEVAQDAWVTIARCIRRLNDPACFPRWAFRILDRRCADWIRRRQIERKRIATLESAPEAESPQATRASDSDEIANLREAIAKLDDSARKLLHLFYETGLSIAEIAEVLDLPQGTVKSRLFKLRELLKSKVERIRL